MTNKSGAIGTATESAIVKYARANGFAGADEMQRAQRLRLAGVNDVGDIGLCPGIIVSAKGGHMAEDASDLEIAVWLAELATQVKNRSGGEYDVDGFLVLKRKGKGMTNVGAWWAVMPGDMFIQLGSLFNTRTFTRTFTYANLPAVKLRFDETLNLLRQNGFGDPLPESDQS